MQIITHKLWLVMRLTTFFILLGMLTVSAHGSAQVINFTRKGAALMDAFAAIEKQSGYTFFYRSEDIRSAAPLSLNLKDASLEEALAELFVNQPLEYSVEGKTIFVSRKKETESPKAAGYPEAGARVSRVPNEHLILALPTVTGYVYSEDKQPLSGASIVVLSPEGKKTTMQTTTDGRGMFTLGNVPDGATLRISFMGYVDQEVVVKANVGVIRLKPSESPLDEVQVIAYGTTSKRLSTGNVGSVKAEDIAKQPVANPLLALQGRVSGLTVVQNSGVAGGGVTVRIQGQNSIANGNDPFYVVDGVPFISQLLPSIGTQLGGSGGATLGYPTRQGVPPGNPFNFINPADIESIEVLKDADATAIYGSRAANGAILITTKKGKAGRTKVDLTMQQGMGQVASKIQLLNTEQYLEMRKEAYLNDGLAVPDATTTPSSQNYDLTVWDQNSYTDWQKELLGGTAQYTDAQVAISGGSPQTTFKLGGGYHRETSVFPGQAANTKGTASVNLNHHTSDQKFAVQFSAIMQHDNNRLPVADFTSLALNLAPNAPAFYNADGTLNWARIPMGTDSVSTWSNPLAAVDAQYQGTTTNLSANSLITYKPIRSLSFSLSFGYNTLAQNEITSTPQYRWAPELRAANYRSATYRNGTVASWIVEPQVNFIQPLGRGEIDVLVGTTFQRINMVNITQSGSGFSSDLLIKDIRSAAVVSVSNSIDAVYKYSALFGRINYNLDDKYILNLTGRRDGSSRFGPENQLQNFGAVGGAWLFHKESFFNPLSQVVSFGKLRASIGTTGSDQIGEYQFMNLYSTASSIVNAYQGVSGLVPTFHSNPYLAWEETLKVQAGLDLGFFNDKLLIGTGYYSNTSSNQLLFYRLPVMTGFASVTSNFPAKIRNSGWEVNVNSQNIRKDNWTWSSTLNFTIPNNELLAFPNIEESSYASSLKIGEPSNTRPQYVAAGVNPTTGIYEFLRADGTIGTTVNFLTDQNAFIDFNPKFFGGFGNTISYEGFSLDVLLQFTKQIGRNHLIGNNPGLFSSTTTGILANQPVYVLDRWQQEGDNTIIQRYSTTLRTANTAASDLMYSDASFVRLKNISISYGFDPHWAHRISLSGLRLFCNAQNLFTITNFKGLDPETQSITNLPPLQTITIGVQVEL